MLRTNDILKTEETRGHPKHKNFRVGVQVSTVDSFYVAFMANISRLSLIGELFPQVTHFFKVKALPDLQPSVLRRQLLRFLPFRGELQEGWNYEGYLLFVRNALGDKGPVQTKTDALRHFKVGGEFANRLDQMRLHLADRDASYDIIAVLCAIFEVCVFVYDTTTEAWEPNVVAVLGATSIGEPKPNVCYRRNVYVARQADGYFVELAPVAIFSQPTPSMQHQLSHEHSHEHSALPLTGFWDDRERFLTMLHMVEDAIAANKLGFHVSSESPGHDDEYLDVHSDKHIISWNDAYTRALRENDLYPTKRFYEYVVKRYAQLRSDFDLPV